MTVETDGTVRIKGDTGAGLAVHVIADRDRIRLVAGNELVGDWEVDSIGISVLSDGFAIRAEGEEIILRADDDAALAEELGVAAAAPRMARRLAARHNTEPAALAAIIEPRSNVTAIGFALAGAMVLLGGTFLRSSGGSEPAAASGEPSGNGFWMSFVVGGLLMTVVAYVMSIGARWARVLAVVAIAVVVVLFAMSVTETGAASRHVAAYGFIAGGMVVGVAVLFGGGTQPPAD